MTTGVKSTEELVQQEQLPTAPDQGLEREGEREGGRGEGGGGRGY